MATDALLEQFCNGLNNLDFAENPESATAAIKAMFAFLEAAITKGSFRDEFEYQYSYGITLTTQATSKKTNARISLNFDTWKKEVSLETHIQHPQYLKSFKDRFLIDFFEVCNQMGISYIDQTSNYDKPAKESIMRLMLNYGTLIANIDDPNIDLGGFRKNWSGNQAAETIFDEACLAIIWLYKFNYHLWKTHHARKTKH